MTFPSPIWLKKALYATRRCEPFFWISSGVLVVMDLSLKSVRLHVKEEEKEVKRNTWFNFMPAKEKPEGLFGSYSPDQIFSSLEWDLLSRNAREVYKYEKDDMLLTEVSVCARREA